ncbi:MAG TPA: pilus assembly protein TadG-related protein [Stellaceae bacterium]|nr:pilus assembly protein TadG-related protein [Stellaceae bacterium]
MREAVGISRKLLCDERAAIGVLGAVSLAAVIGISALVVEYGHGLLKRSDNQRVADLAAYGGVYNTIYNATGSIASATTSGKSAAINIAALNGLTGDGVTITSDIVMSPRRPENNAMQVTVTTNLPMYLAEMLLASTTLPVTATSDAEIVPAPPGSVGPPTVALVQ